MWVEPMNFCSGSCGPFHTVNEQTGGLVTYLNGVIPRGEKSRQRPFLVSFILVWKQTDGRKSSDDWRSHPVRCAFIHPFCPPLEGLAKGASLLTERVVAGK